MSEQQSVEIDLDKLRARMQLGPITEEQIDLLFALVETSREQARKAEIGRLAWTEIGAKAQDAARVITQKADDLADAVEQAHEMRRAAEIDPARNQELAAASYRLGAALSAYRAAQKARHA